MITFSDPIKWQNSTVTKVSGTVARTGIYTSMEGMEANFTPELISNIFSNSSPPIPLYLTHGNRDHCGYMYKLGYDQNEDLIQYEGFIFDTEKGGKIRDEGFDSVSPEIEFDMQNGVPVSGKITGTAFVRHPAISGTKASLQMVAFSVPEHKWKYGKSEAAWSAPSLSDFTSKPWGELSEPERADIASHYAYSGGSQSFGELKFPHHEPKSNAVNWHAVANAMTRLNQADISPQDKKEVYAHLANHYKEFDKEPPKMFSGDGDLIMVNQAYSIDSTSGTYTFTPISITTGGASTSTGGASTTGTTTTTNVYSYPDIEKVKADFQSEIDTLKKKVADFEAAAEVAQATADANAQALNDYKQKYETLLAREASSIETDLRGLGMKTPEEIGKSLGVEQRIPVLQTVKENIVRNAPVTQPTQENITPAPTTLSRDEQIVKLMKENGVDPVNMKYLKK